MKEKFFFYYTVLYFIIFLIVLPNVYSAEVQECTSLKLIFKNCPQSEPFTKIVKKNLNRLAKDIEKNKNLYVDANKIVYWELENEAKKSFLRYLYSEGYYNITIETEFLESENIIIFYLSNWERYRVKKILLKYLKNSNQNINIPETRSLKLKVGDFARASSIVEFQKDLIKNIEDSNCLLNLNINHQVIIDEYDSSVIINFIVNAGPYVTIESVDVKGLNSLNKDYVKKLIPLKKGQCFNHSLIREAQLSLQKSGLFTLTSYKILSDSIRCVNKVKILFNLKEQKHRNIRVGFNYRNDLGLGVTLGWNHKNFFGNGEIIKSKIFTNKKEELIELEFIKNFLKRTNQNLRIGIFQKKGIFKDYSNRELVLFSAIERTISGNLTANVATKYSHNCVKKFRSLNNYSFLSIPLFIKYDTKDDILNPSKGYDLQFKVEIFSFPKKICAFFFKEEITLAKYIPLTTDLTHIIAIKVSTGTLNGSKFLLQQAKKMSYRAEDQLIRGYTSRYLSLDNEKKNSQFRNSSMFLSNIEFRSKLKDYLGMVVFLDSGNIFRSKIPKIKKMLHGFGIGIRYFTNFGPLKLDLAFPLNVKENNKPFQIYLGIGQSF